MAHSKFSQTISHKFCLQWRQNFHHRIHKILKTQLSCCSRPSLAQTVWEVPHLVISYGSAAIAKEGSLAWNIATPTAPSSWSRITRRIFRSGLRAAAAYCAGAAAAYRAWVAIEYKRRETENRAPVPRVFFHKG
jgi:hypothetical protein